MTINAFKRPILTALLLALILSGCGNKTSEGSSTGSTAKLPISHTYYTFGTVVNVKVYDIKVTEEHFLQIDQILKTVELELNRENKDSEIYRVNQAAGVKPIRVTEPTFKAVKAAMGDAISSHGIFDPTVGPLVDLWGVGKANTKKPDDASVKKALTLVDYKDVVLDDAAQTIYLKRTGMSIDLGGTGKGFAADLIADYLRAQGLNSAIVDMGGNLLTVGVKPGGGLWKIGIQDPDQARGASVGTMMVNNKAVVASGIYERFFMENGVHYHHIMDTTTGYPAQNELASVTIITDNAMAGEGLDNMVFCHGLQEGLRFVDSLDNVEAVFITKDRKVYVSKGLKGQLAMSNSDFELIEE
ncbi:MAG: FAD:protein FMN transferase [Gorillibacterium sp.]|nr:FAD:protein FMN transferase [Gorillibacterium sp.]